MGIDDLRKKFIVDEHAIKERLEPIVELALEFCVIDKQGQVHISDGRLSAKNKVMLVLAARAVASQLDPSIPPDVGAGEIGMSTGLPKNQIRARVKEIINAKLARSSGRGVYRAVPHKVEPFLEGLAGGPKSK